MLDLIEKIDCANDDEDAFNTFSSGLKDTHNAF